MRFVFPTAEYESKAIAYIDEFHEHGAHINGTGALDSYIGKDGYQSWLCKIRNEADIANVSGGMSPGYTYFYVDGDDEIVGMINIRINKNSEFVRNEIGNIGYSIRPTMWGRGLATQMLKGALEFLNPLANEITLVCASDNAASERVIQKCGGVLEAEFYSDTFGEQLKRYVIMLE